MAVLLDGFRQMRRVSRSFQQVDSFHQTIEGVERHHRSIGSIEIAAYVGFPVVTPTYVLQW